MRRFLRIALATLVIVAVLAIVAVVVVRRALAPPPPLAPLATSFVLDDVTLVLPDGRHAEHRQLGVHDGKIALASPGAGPLLAQFRGMFVAPGLVDMHGHLPPDNALRLTSHVLLLYLAHGVTSLRDAADIDGTARRGWQRAVDDGYPSPRVASCGPFVSAGRAKWANTRLLAGPDEAEAVVAELARQGSACIKAYDGLSLPMVEALRAAAARHHLPMIGHVPAALSYEQARIPDVQHLMGIASGDIAADPNGTGHAIHSITGWDAIDDARMRAVVEATLRFGIANTPTLVSGDALLGLADHDAARASPTAQLLPRLYREVVWDPSHGIATYRGMQPHDFAELRAANAKRLELVRRLHQAGATLYLGTDTLQPFVVPGASLVREMQLFRAAGIATAEVWDMASERAGRALGVPQLGTLTDGAPADLVILRKDPSLDPDAIESIEAVIAGGKLYLARDLQAKLAEYRAHEEGTVFDWLSTTLARRALARTAVAP